MVVKTTKDGGFVEMKGCEDPQMPRLRLLATQKTSENSLEKQFTWQDVSINLVIRDIQLVTATVTGAASDSE